MVTIHTFLNAIPEINQILNKTITDKKITKKTGQ